MVVDGTRIPAPSPSRSRLARPASSRIPAPRTAREPRAPKTPTGIPAPRRLSRDPATPPARRPPGAPADRTDPPSARTPRRSGVRAPTDEKKTPRSGIPTPRRMSKEPQRVGLPRYANRLSASSQEPPTNRPRTAGASGTPQSAVPKPSPRRPAHPPARPGLSPSPYSRRTSTGGNVRTMAGVTPRKLNMGHDDDTRRAPTATTGSRRLSVAQERMMDRVEAKRESYGGTKRGKSALESFRAARRASVEAERKKKADHQRDVVMTDAPRSSIAPMNSPRRNALPDRPDPTPLHHRPDPLPDRQDPLALPDRPDPLTPGKNLTPGRSRRKSTRFSDAEINLDGVEQLNKSLGRRRSIGYGEPIPYDMETPTLRRSSIGERLALGAELERQEMEARAALENPNQQRLPLGSIETNQEHMQTSEQEKTEKRRSIIPTLEGEEFEWGNEDVEDLRP